MWAQKLHGQSGSDGGVLKNDLRSCQQQNTKENAQRLLTMTAPARAGAKSAQVKNDEAISLINVLDRNCFNQELPFYAACARAHHPAGDFLDPKLGWTPGTKVARFPGDEIIKTRLNGQELFFVPVRSSKGHQTRIQVCTKLPCTSQQTIAIMNDFQPVDEKGQALGTADGMIDAVTLFGEVKMKGSALNTASNIQVALNLDRASAIATNGEVSENADRFREAQRIALLKTNGLDALASENSPGKM